MPKTIGKVRDVAQEPFLLFLRDQEFRSHHIVFHTFFILLFSQKMENVNILHVLLHMNDSGVYLYFI